MNQRKFPIGLISLFALAVAMTLTSAGCSRILPPRKAAAHSANIVIDTRRGPYETLTGCFIPAVFPAVTKLPVFLVQPIPAGAKFTEVTVEVQAKNGDELALLQPVIEENKIYLKFAAAKAESFTQVIALVKVKYEYR